MAAALYDLRHAENVNEHLNVHRIMPKGVENYIENNNDLAKPCMETNSN